MNDYLIKAPEEIEKMRIVGKLAADVLEMIEPYVKIGRSTEELNEICHSYIVKEQKGIPAPLNYRGYPKSICTSINNVVCHGIPDKRKLKDGDIINIDVTVMKDGYYGDTSKMFLVGDVSIIAKRIVNVARQCMYDAIKLIRPGAHIGDFGEAMQRCAEKNNFSVVKNYCGHGIGRQFHEQPNVQNFGTRNTGMVVTPGMIFTIEPMVNVGTDKTKVLSDKWTVVTSDQKLSAQWEHTILVTSSGYEILTWSKSDEIPAIA